MKKHKVPSAVLNLASRQAAKISAERVSHPRPPAMDREEPEAPVRRSARDKIVSGLKKLHPMD